MSDDERDRTLAEAEHFGVDLSLLRENLKLTPHERHERHLLSLELVEELQRARRAAHVPAPTHPAQAK